MSSNKYISNGDCKFNISYHIVWIPKYRKHILTDSIETRFKQLINEKIIKFTISCFRMYAISCSFVY